MLSTRVRMSGYRKDQLTYLYNEGNTFEAKTGGYKLAGFSRGSGNTFSLELDHIHLRSSGSSNQTISMITTNSIDLSIYSKALVTYMHNCTTTNNFTSYIGFFIDDGSWLPLHPTHGQLETWTNDITGSFLGVEEVQYLGQVRTIEVPLTGANQNLHFGGFLNQWTDSKTQDLKIYKVELIG